MPHRSETIIHPKYPATYLGIDVAIKEILPSDDYDVRKYFDREWSLMRFVSCLVLVAMYPLMLLMIDL